MGLGLAVAPGAALADRAAADRCAAGLQPLGKTLFERALPDILRGTEVSTALRTAALGLVMSGAVTRDAARPAAEAAGACLSQVARPG